MNHDGEQVAIIGMSGRFPGAENIAEFWENLCANRDSIRTLSDDELRSAGVAQRDIADSAYVKVSASLNDVDKFDPGFFKISPREAELMDPQIRLLLQCAWETLEDAGYARKAAQNTGVFVGGGGVVTSYFASLANVSERVDNHTAGATHLGNDKDFLATYLSYKLNLTGPGVTVQTACSTSLVALHQARLSLLNGECDTALAGGVSIRVPHNRGYHYRDGYIFSRTGKSRAFDAGADGVVFGSGVGLVLIKRLSDAVRDGDNIYAVIRGGAISNDGKEKMSYAASSARGQVACVQRALSNAQIDPQTLGFIESHGTGTAMGDPEEVKALSAALREHTDKTAFCALGAVKNNVGHLEAAAGIVSLIKAALVVKTGIIPPVTHYTQPNPKIHFEKTPFYVNTALKKWGKGKTPRRAAVNSLGVGGTNAFLILEEFVPPRRARKKALPGPFIVPLSARTEAALQRAVARLHDFLAVEEKIDLANVAYTLQVGREAMAHRAAFVISSHEELCAALANYPHAAVANPDDGREMALAGEWLAGADVDWNTLYPAGKPQRISLPTYVFERERYWIEAQMPAPAQPRIHPLLHTNTSDLHEQKFVSTFSSDEFFLRDHQVCLPSSGADAEARHNVLPAVGYLEMARAALAQAMPADSEPHGVEYRDVVWSQPLDVAGTRQVHIALIPGAPSPAGGQNIGFEVYTADGGIHCQGYCCFGHTEAEQAPTLAQRAGVTDVQTWSADEVYRRFAAMGLHYGLGHRTLTAVERSEQDVMAELALSETLLSTLNDYVLHPGLADGALQAAALLLVNPASSPVSPPLPFTIASVRILAPCREKMRVWARYAPGTAQAHSPRIDIDLLAADGTLCAQFSGVILRQVGKPAAEPLLAARQWRETPSVPGTGEAAPLTRHVLLYRLAHVAADELCDSCQVVPWQAKHDVAQAYSAFSLACFNTLRELMAAKPQGNTLVQIVLSNDEDSDMFAGLAGLLRTATLENPHIVGQLLFVDADITTAALRERLAAERVCPQEPLIKYQHAVRYTPVWQPLPDSQPGAVRAEIGFKQRGVYLITGGLGGLGMLFAQEILARAADATIILTGRASASKVAHSAVKQAQLAALQQNGARVEYLQLDLSQRDGVKKRIAALVKKHGQLNGLIHCAGQTADSFILNKSPEDFLHVLTPKVSGTLNLDDATRNVDLDFMALFSSLTSALGNPGQADYAAANGFMDAFAERRQRLVAAGERRGKTVSIGWGLWQDGGMQPGATDKKRLGQATGIVPMQTSTAMALFYRALAAPCANCLAMEGSLPRMMQALTANADAPARNRQREARPSGDEPADLRASTAAWLGAQLATVLKLPAQNILPDASFDDFGLDSILALDLTAFLEKTFGALPKTLFFEYLNLRELSEYFISAHGERLAALFAAGDAPALAQTSVPHGARESLRGGAHRYAGRAAPAHSAEPIAIVGLSGRYPQSPDLSAYWRNLRDGKDCIIEVPRERWDWRDYYTADRTEKGRHYSKWGGFIEGVDEFDARFFSIAPPEAEKLDPQERLFLQHVWMAMEDAGYTRSSLQIEHEGDLPAQVGVYAGVMYGEYQLFGAQASLQGNRMGFASNLASIANRVSYVLNLHGPSMVVDTMCSSSLTAIHLACQDLRLGKTALGIAGGVNVTIHPNKYLMLSAGQFISSDGHCQSFGAGGDGYIPGEGVGVVLLKRLSDAERDGNPIYGVIKGSALSHGGKTHGFTVPNPQAQASAIRQALAEAGVDARHISYVEAHGTGTRLGDPIEIAALSNVFQASTQETAFCRIGSAKSNIGHCEAAAGIAGLTKVLLQFKNQQIAPSLHAEQLNPHIDFARTPFVVNQTLRRWEQPIVAGKTIARIAGISSFGAGGSNAHLIVEEYQRQASTPMQPAADYLVVLSARNEEQLRQKARDLLAWIQVPTPPTLAAIAWTLQAGREAMDARLAIVVQSVETLADGLSDYLAERPSAQPLWQGSVKADKEMLSARMQEAHFQDEVNAWVAQRQYAGLAALWVSGFELNWRAFYINTPPFISLPTYPFARQRFWVNTGASSGTQNGVPTVEVLHPLLHRNLSDLRQQRYSMTPASDAFFMVERERRRTITEAACLEMACAALTQAMAPQQAEQRPELYDVAWTQPADVAADAVLNIALFDERAQQVKFEIYAPGADGQEIILCQGHARYHSTPAPGQDVASAQNITVPLVLPAELTAQQGTYTLHPALLQQALATVAPLLTLASLRVYAPCVTDGSARIYAAQSPQTQVDIDICDAQGNVCARLSGAVPAQAERAQTGVINPSLPPQANRGRAVALPARHALVTEAASRKPHGGITLMDKTAACAPVLGSATKPSILLPRALAVAEGVQPASAAPVVSLFAQENGVYSLIIHEPAARSAPADELFPALLQALAVVAQAAEARVLIIEGGETGLLAAGGAHYRAALQSGFYQTLVEFPCPVIAAMVGDASGAGFIAALLCDFMVCSETAHYAFTQPQDGLWPAQVESLLRERLGETLTTDFLYLNATTTGDNLRRGGWLGPVVAAHDVLAHAQRLADELARKEPPALRLLKRHLARHVAVQSALITADVPQLPETPAAFTHVTAPSARLRLERPAESVLVVTLCQPAPGETSAALLDDLDKLFSGIDQTLPYRCVVLRSELTTFLPVNDGTSLPDNVRRLDALLLGFSLPVVVVLEADADALGWYTGLLGDVCVCNEQGHYHWEALAADPLLMAHMLPPASARCGAENAKTLLLTRRSASGSELREQYGIRHVIAAPEAYRHALRLAENLSRLSSAQLIAWKTARGTALSAGREALLLAQAAESPAGAPRALPTSAALTTVMHPHGILEICMTERVHKNRFSVALSDGLREAFAHAASNPACKVVVLSGYDNYFAAGGTKETLLAIHAGTAKFTDNDVYQLPMRCPLPVIAAMQGHGIGAGWALGMYADLILFSEESHYVSPYMDYGFTPGAGSTLVFRQKFGEDLARESLMSAHEYSGAALKARGILYPVLPRNAVLASALALAENISRFSRAGLIGMKQYWNSTLNAQLPDTLERELAMHASTFTGQSAALARILERDTSEPEPHAVAVLSETCSSSQDVSAELRAMLADELRMAESEIDDDEQFVDLGLDSITGVTWVRRINERFGTAIEAIKVYSYPTLARMSQYVGEEAQKAGGLTQENAPLVTPESTLPASVTLVSWRSNVIERSQPEKADNARASAIAVIGMAGQFAGAHNLDEFWRNLAAGVDSISEIPPSRWDITRYYQPGDAAPGKTYSKWLGMLDGHDCFDAAFFNISPREARAMDPQQRLFLQTCWHGIEHAGYNPRALAGSQCGVFVGCSAGDYHLLSQRARLSGQGFIGAAPSILAARISYFLDLHGPSLAIDTACSSSLVAIASACDSLVSGACDSALAGGVYVMSGPSMQIMTAQVGMLSPHGRCFTFDERADGIVNGEGVGVVMLKRLADAERDGDTVYGVIEGWGVNQDGKTNGITAPNADLQSAVQQRVYERFDIDPGTIQLVEAHGTATALGDPIEVSGLCDAFRKYTDKSDYCALGSVKSNIGHCLTAAGVSGFLKLLLALQNEQLPPTLHFQRLNRHIPLAGSPFYINDRLRAWPTNGTQPRRAAINAFGFSGTNAHVVLAGHARKESHAMRSDTVIIPLSAATDNQLRQQAQNLLAWLDASDARLPPLDSIAWTLQTGREAMNARVAFIASDLTQLRHRLQAYLAGAATSGVFQGAASGNAELLQSVSRDDDFQQTVANWLRLRELANLAQWWVKGLPLAWQTMYAPHTAPRRIGLPGYPFAMERHWLAAAELDDADVPLPVVQKATSAPPAQPMRAAPVPQQPAAREAFTHEQLRQHISTSLAQALFMQPGDIDANRSFTDMGLDSIIGVEWVNALNKQFGTGFGATQIYDYPTVTTLAEFIYGQTGAGATPPQATAMPVTLAPVAVPAVQALSLQLRDSLADALLMPPAEVDLNRSFMELGLDSIIGVEWVKALNKRYHIGLPAVSVYDYPSVNALAAHIQSLLVKEAGTAVHDTNIRVQPDHAVPALYFSPVGSAGSLAADGEASVDYVINPCSTICWQEHVVFGEHLLPTDAYIELIHNAYRVHFSTGHISLQDMVIVNPLLGNGACDTSLRVVLRRIGERLQFLVKSSATADFQSETLHVRGFIATQPLPPVPRIGGDFEVEQVRAGVDIPTNSGRYYAPLTQLRFGAQTASGSLHIPAHDFHFLTQPFVLYGGLCTAINFALYLAAGADGDQFLPYRIGAIDIMETLHAGDYLCHVELREREPDEMTFTLEIVDEQGRQVAVLEALRLRRVSSKSRQARTATPAQSMENTAHPAEAVAIIGMSCRFPHSEDADAFWDNLVAGRDCVTDVPAGRWDNYPDWYHADPRHPHTSCSRWGGFLQNIDAFDPLFFGLSPAEAEIIEPQQRIFMEESWKAIENAGYAPGALADSACGVYVGCATGDYVRILGEAGKDTLGAAFMGTSSAILAGRVAYHLNLKGAALAVDTACSSGLVALHLACDSIRSGENTMALAGGINLLTTPVGHILTSQVGMLSPDGRCAAFDADANGIVFSEGCGVVLLKALSQAQADNDTILGVIRGSGINQDGKTNGITAPSARSQEKLLRQVYDRYRIDPARISYVEAHGTGTALGDPIEVNALSAAFRQATSAQGYCALGSVKSNIGHTGFASGIASLIKVLLCLRHRQQVPTLHYRQPNPHIDFASSPFYVNTEYGDWQSDAPRLAGVSSFGFSGTNAHVVVEEYVQGQPLSPTGADEAVIVPLSAKSAAQLEQKVRDLLAFLQRPQPPVSLPSLAWTLQAGRDTMDYRLALIANSTEQLTLQLAAVVRGENAGDGIYRAQAGRNDGTLALFAEDTDIRDVIDRWIARKNLPKIADLWVRGMAMEWARLYSGPRPRRINLPVYPFARERCWVTQDSAAQRAGAASQRVLHPLLHQNTSNLNHQRYDTWLRGDEFFLTDHRVNGERVLPAVAYLETLRAALEDALPAEQADQLLTLRHIIWPQPLVVTQEAHIRVALYADDTPDIGVEISQLVKNADDILHCQGSALSGPVVPAPRLDLAHLRARMHRDDADCYAHFRTLGLDYGPAFRCITGLYRAGSDVLVELSRPAAKPHDIGRYVLDPGLVDSALQGSILLMDKTCARVPFALESLRVFSACTDVMSAWIRYTPGSQNSVSELTKVDIDMCDSEGNVCVEMRGFSSRPVENRAAFDEAHYQSIISGILNQQISADDATELG